MLLADHNYHLNSLQILPLAVQKHCWKHHSRHTSKMVCVQVIAASFLSLTDEMEVIHVEGCPGPQLDRMCDFLALYTLLRKRCQIFSNASLEKIHCLAKLYSLEQQLGTQCVDTLGGHDWLDRRMTSTAVLYLVAATLHWCLIHFQVSSQTA